MTEAEEKESGKMENQQDAQNQEAAPIIPGTTYKSIEDVAKALQEKDAMIARQGNEVGSLRTQHSTLMQAMEKLSAGGQGKPEAQAVKPDYQTEIATVDQAIDKLDPMSDSYQSELRNLIAKRTDLVASIQHEKTLNAASEVFKKELNERDARMTKQKWFEENPSFNTPEMQARIQEYIARDKTGMADPLSAFREIERDDARMEAQRLAKENEEFQKLLKLKGGRDEAGRVITKGQSPATQSKPQKATGKELDNGMRAILMNMP